MNRFLCRLLVAGILVLRVSPSAVGQQFPEGPDGGVTPQLCVNGEVEDVRGDCCLPSEIGACNGRCGGPNPQQTQATILDRFSYTVENMTGQPGSLSSSVNGQTASLIQAFAGAFGGTRSVQITPSSGGAGSRIDFDRGYTGRAGSISFNNISGATGDVLLSYDGDDVAGLSDFTGLCATGSCLNLLQGNATGLQFGVWFDFLSTIPVELEFTFYDGSDRLGQRYTSFAVALDRRYDSIPYTELFVPFLRVTSIGPSGAADLSRIGAFTIAIRGGQAFAADVSLSSVRTDGVVSSCL